MREIRQSGSEGGGNEQTVSPYPYVALCLLPFTFLLPSSPPTVLGGSAFYTCIIQKQKTHGAQSMGFEVIH